MTQLSRNIPPSPLKKDLLFPLPASASAPSRSPSPGAEGAYSPPPEDTTNVSFAGLRGTALPTVSEARRRHDHRHMITIELLSYIAQRALFFSFHAALLILLLSTFLGVWFVFDNSSVCAGEQVVTNINQLPVGDACASVAPPNGFIRDINESGIFCVHGHSNITKRILTATPVPTAFPDNETETQTALHTRSGNTGTPVPTVTLPICGAGPVNVTWTGTTGKLSILNRFLYLALVPFARPPDSRGRCDASPPPSAPLWGSPPTQPCAGTEFDVLRYNVLDNFLRVGKGDSFATRSTLLQVSLRISDGDKVLYQLDHGDFPVVCKVDSSGKKNQQCDLVLLEEFPAHSRYAHLTVVMVVHGLDATLGPVPMQPVLMVYNPLYSVFELAMRVILLILTIATLGLLLYRLGWRSFTWTVLWGPKTSGAQPLHDDIYFEDRHGDPQLPPPSRPKVDESPRISTWLHAIVEALPFRKRTSANQKSKLRDPTFHAFDESLLESSKPLPGISPATASASRVSSGAYAAPQFVGADGVSRAAVRSTASPAVVNTATCEQEASHPIAYPEQIWCVGVLLAMLIYLEPAFLFFPVDQRSYYQTGVQVPTVYTYVDPTPPSAKNYYIFRVFYYNDIFLGIVKSFLALLAESLASTLYVQGEDMMSSSVRYPAFLRFPATYVAVAVALVYGIVANVTTRVGGFQVNLSTIIDAIWFVWVSSALIRAHFSLRSVPYAIGRARHLLFRFILFFGVSFLLTVSFQSLWCLLHASHGPFASTTQELQCNLKSHGPGILATSSLFVLLCAYVLCPAKLRPDAPPPPLTRSWVYTMWRPSWKRWLDTHHAWSFYFFYSASEERAFITHQLDSAEPEEIQLDTVDATLPARSVASARPAACSSVPSRQPQFISISDVVVSAKRQLERTRQAAPDDLAATSVALMDVALHRKISPSSARTQVPVRSRQDSISTRMLDVLENSKISEFFGLNRVIKAFSHQKEFSKAFFNLETAALMFNVSWQVYGHPEPPSEVAHLSGDSRVPRVRRHFAATLRKTDPGRPQLKHPTRESVEGPDSFSDASDVAAALPSVPWSAGALNSAPFESRCGMDHYSEDFAKVFLMDGGILRGGPLPCGPRPAEVWESPEGGFLIDTGQYGLSLRRVIWGGGVQCFVATRDCETCVASGMGRRVTRDDVVAACTGQPGLCPHPRDIVVCFRGTSSLENVRSDVTVHRRPVSFMTYPTGRILGRVLQGPHLLGEGIAKAHAGFSAAYDAVKADVLFTIATLVKLLPRYDGEPSAIPRPRIYITGHSLGGAIATLCAVEVAKWIISSFGCGDSLNRQQQRSYSLVAPGPELVVYTFGSPRVGNRTFAKKYDRLVPHTFRIVNDNDPIPSSPPTLGIMFRHVGIEVVLDERGNMIVNPSLVERNYRPQNLLPDFVSVTHHFLRSYAMSLDAVCKLHSVPIRCLVGAHDRAVQRNTRARRKESRSSVKTPQAPVPIVPLVDV